MPISADLFCRIGRTLHGDEFVTGLAKDLDIGWRNVQRMAAASLDVPEGVPAELADLLRRHTKGLLLEIEQAKKPV